MMRESMITETAMPSLIEGISIWEPMWDSKGLCKFKLVDIMMIKPEQTEMTTELGSNVLHDKQSLWNASQKKKLSVVKLLENWVLRLNPGESTYLIAYKKNLWKVPNLLGNRIFSLKSIYEHWTYRKNNGLEKFNKTLQCKIVL